MSEELERNAYELSREEIRQDQKRQEREEEERQREEYENECARRLARYDEAVRLLRECVEWAGVSDCPGLNWLDLQVDRDSYAEAMAFLAAEPQEER